MSSPYREAASLLTQVITEHKSLKALACKQKSCSKVAYAQVCHTLQHKSILESILDHNGGRLRENIQADKVRNIGLLYVLLFELLFGKHGNIRGGGMMKRNIMKFEKELRKTKDELILKKGGTLNAIEKTYTFPRYIRVNTLKATVEEVILILQRDLRPDDNKPGDTPSIDDMDCIFSDPHVPDLLIVSPKASIQWHTHELVTSGKIILQDKSSCFSALALVYGNNINETDGGDYIDACAAPGNKTSHLAALIHKSQLEVKKENSKIDKCKIFAFDRSSNRISILRHRISQMVPLHDKVINKSAPLPEVVTLHEDFLKADPKNNIYKNVRCILLDPSCSGSGIIDNPDRFLHPAGTGDESTGKGNKGDRIKTLSNFQLLILKHAMSFPQVQRIVYSTCSVNDMENEHVVACALNEANDEIEEDEMKWNFVTPIALQSWKRRGHTVSGLTKMQAKSLVRVDGKDGDDTNGFFVSYFERNRACASACVSLTNSLLTLAPGVKVYDGEFRDQRKIISSDTIKKTKDVRAAVKIDENAHSVSKTTVKASDGKQKSKMAKKRSHAIMWKREQKKKKLLRMKNAPKKSE